MIEANGFLHSALKALEDRAAVRDKDEERSMERTVDAFNALHKTNLTEEQGWQFMILLKLARASAGNYHADDYTDICGYGALAGECGSKNSEVSNEKLSSRNN